MAPSETPEVQEDDGSETLSIPVQRSSAHITVATDATTAFAVEGLVNLAALTNSPTVAAQKIMILDPTRYHLAGVDLAPLFIEEARLRMNAGVAAQAAYHLIECAIRMGEMDADALENFFDQLRAVAAHVNADV